MEKPKGKSLIRKPRLRWVDILINLREIGLVVWTEMISSRIGTRGGLL
jgi:hypothetical protein